MATDYDTPRKTDDDVDQDSLEELKARRNDKSTSAVDVDEFEQAEGLELPGADLSNEELSVRVLPRQADEFTCMSCFLVHHRSSWPGRRTASRSAATATEAGGRDRPTRPGSGASAPRSGRGPPTARRRRDDGAGPARGPRSRQWTRRASGALDGAGAQGACRQRRAAPVGQGVSEGVRKGGAARRPAAFVADRIIDNAPRIPVRDLATLRRQFPGLGPEELADKLVRGRVQRATSTVGAGVGAAAMLPVPPAMPTELAAEITGVAAIEMKLIAELYEVYGLRPPGNVKQRAIAYLSSWAEERGVDVTKPSTINAALGGQMKRELRQQIMKRMVRSLPNLVPFMVGAAVGAVMNRRDTEKARGSAVRKDLRKVAGCLGRPAVAAAAGAARRCRRDPRGYPRRRQARSLPLTSAWPRRAKF